MGFRPHRKGPHNPVESTPTLAPGWTRWTFHVDGTSVGGFPTALLRFGGAARAVHADAAGNRATLHSVDIGFDTDGMVRTLLSMAATDGDRPLPLDPLIGHSTAAGFRARLQALWNDHPEPSPLATFLLDDVPGIALVATYAEQYEDSRSGSDVIGQFLAASPEAIDFQSGTCAGWAEEAGLIKTLRNERELLTPVGPLAPSLWDTGHDTTSSNDAPVGEWHPIAPLVSDSTRRIRRIDLGPETAQGRRFVTHFRDSHADADGVERVLHEYLVEGTVSDGAIASLRAEARVLPWQECPGAVASAQRAVGHRVAGLRSLVRSDFRGESTCTHLNDTVRSLESLAAMAPHSA
ncbi:MAG: DUF2889 domain-containing protein [Actinobacteria bacterium]|nr:DUF2889 domain-containing protein [Actinomycetota bacterium]